ncbi:sensor histidine kinase [Frigidibacter sp. MR17.24]|uniref:sensor histidine kinase n=1 Tax=Frigidibacter sp. MR17.24 TaxID=3127345 RepID=UPI003012FC5C
MVRARLASLRLRLLVALVALSSLSAVLAILLYLGDGGHRVAASVSRQIHDSVRQDAQRLDAQLTAPRARIEALAQAPETRAALTPGLVTPAPATTAGAPSPVVSPAAAPAGAPVTAPAPVTEPVTASPAETSAGPAAAASTAALPPAPGPGAPAAPRLANASPADAAPTGPSLAGPLLSGPSASGLSASGLSDSGPFVAGPDAAEKDTADTAMADATGSNAAAPAGPAPDLPEGVTLYSVQGGWHRVARAAEAAPLPPGAVALDALPTGALADGAPRAGARGSAPPATPLVVRLRGFELGLTRQAAIVGRAGPDGTPVLQLLSAVHGTDGTLLGAVVAMLPVAALSAGAGIRGLGGGTRYRLLDTAGEVADLTPPPGTPPKPLPLMVQAPLGAGAPGVKLVATVPGDVMAAMFSTARWRQDGVAAALILAAVGMAWAAALWLTRPLVAMRAFVEGRSTRDSAPATMARLVAGADEIGTIARGFAALTLGSKRDAARLRAIFDCAPVGIVMVDGAGVIETVNLAGAAMFGYDCAALKGRPLTALMPHEAAARHDHHLAAARVGADALRIAPEAGLEGMRRDGSRFPVEVVVSRADYDGSRHYLGIIEDVTQRRALEAQRDGLIAALARSNEELDQFAYIASHDLKAPLRVIGNAARWLEEDLEAHLTEDTRETLDLMTGRVTRMERLLDALLEHSRIGRVQSGVAEVSGDELLEDVRAMVALPPGFTLEVAPGFGAIRLPRLPIATVLINLIGNAVKHHDRPTGQVRLAVRELPESFVFTVADDGPGIPPAYHDKVFEMFQTLRPRDQVEGSGMGLAMVRKYVVTAGGQIALASDGGRGTCFTVTWPRAARSSAARIWAGIRGEEAAQAAAGSPGGDAAAAGDGATPGTAVGAGTAAPPVAAETAGDAGPADGAAGGTEGGTEGGTGDGAGVGTAPADPPGAPGRRRVA